MASYRHLKSALTMGLMIAVFLGFWYSRSEEGLKIFVKPTFATPSHIKVFVNANLEDYEELFYQTHRYAKQLLENKVADYSEADLKATLQKRWRQVQTACSLMKKENFTTDWAENQFVFYKNVRTVFCPVPKAASKFWTRMLHVLDTDNHESPFEIGHIRKPRLKDQMINMTLDHKEKNVQTVLNDSFSFIFARNPYKRIFATYVDKYFSPNNLYRSRAVNMIYHERHKNVTCGNDLRFSELVKNLIFRTPEVLDVHFRPVSILCDMCDVQYDVIGKVETFPDDVQYILNRIPNAKKILFKDFEQENSIFYITFNVERTHKMLHDLLKCDTYQAIYQRLWRQLQMSGMIEKHLNYPLAPAESKRLNISSLTNLFLDAYHRSTSGARSNKREAYLQAYREVPLEHMEQLRLKYLKDFMLFDYETRPKELFDRDFSSTENDGFDYFDILKTS